MKMRNDEPGELLDNRVRRGEIGTDVTMLRANLSQTRLLRAEEVARILNIGKSTVYLLCREQKIPHVVIGHSVRIPENSLREWLEANIALPNRE